MSRRSPSTWIHFLRHSAGRIDTAYWGLLIFTVAFAVRILLMVRVSYDGRLEASEHLMVARALAHRGAFADPHLVLPTGATAHVAPLFPFLASVLLGLIGPGRPLDVVLHTLSTAASALQFALLPALAAAFLRDRWPGILAGLIAAMLPFRLLLETAGNFETTYCAAALALLFLGASRWLAHPLPGLRTAGIYGAAWGIAALLSPTVLPVFAGLCFLWIVGHRNIRALLPVTVAVLCCAAVILPWTARNYLVLGTPTLIRDNYGLELAVSNHPKAYAMMDDNYDFNQSEHPFDNIVEARKMRHLGEIAYYRQRTAQARRWISQNPGPFARLTLARFWDFWFMPTRMRVKTAFYAGITLLAFAGLWLLYRRDRSAAAAFATVPLLYPLPYYLVQISARYRLPMDWLTWLLAAYAVWAAVEWLDSSRKSSTQKSGLQRLSTIGSP